MSDLPIRRTLEHCAAEYRRLRQSDRPVDHEEARILVDFVGGPEHAEATARYLLLLAGAPSDAEATAEAQRQRIRELERQLDQVRTLFSEAFGRIRALAATATPPEPLGRSGDASDFHDGLYRVPVDAYQDFGRAITDIQARLQTMTAVKTGR